MLALHAKKFRSLVQSNPAEADTIGVELARLDREMDSDIGVIFATGHADIPWVRKFASVVILVEPYGESDFVSAIGRAMLDRAVPEWRRRPR